MNPRGLYDLGLWQEVYMCLWAHYSNSCLWSYIEWPRIECLTERTALQVLQIKGIGPKRFAHIERVLKRNRLALRKD